jgi:transcriptional regulator with GAF, ATPase, and Fis domain
VLADVDRVAATDATVLVTGETGTGKELIARAIHRKSARAKGPLVTVNCAAIPGNLQESELFGHEKGAFTGALQRRDGRFKLADKGTLFLDEVGEMPPELQAKLLRVLQEGEFEPLGSPRTLRVDVRVVAATNKDLAQMAREGTFRADLLYRLDVFPLHLPPLRERGEDVALLAEAFARGFAKRRGRAVAPLSPDDKARLRRYDWPGNVRELQNVIERALITSRDGRTLNLDRALPEASAPIAAPADPERVLTVTELEDLERRNVERALAAAGWKISGEDGAARLLGLNPNTLASRMKRLGIRKSAERS